MAAIVFVALRAEHIRFSATVINVGGASARDAVDVCSRREVKMTDKATANLTCLSLQDSLEASFRPLPHGPPPSRRLEIQYDHDQNRENGKYRLHLSGPVTCPNDPSRQQALLEFL